MAKRTFIGRDASGAGAIKIMATAGFDPVTTPDNVYTAFVFNSKDLDQFRFCGTDLGQRLVTSDDTALYQPAGAGNNSYTKINYAGLGSSPYNAVAWTNAFFPSLDYALPLFDIRPIRNGYYWTTVVERRTYGYQDRAGEYSLGGAVEPGWMENFLHASGGSGRSRFGTSAKNLLGTIAASSSSYGDFWGLKRIVVYNLPGDETPVKDPPQAPVSGQMQVQINSQVCRVAKPGYDVRNASRTQLAFDSSNRPLKAIYAADIALPSGQTNIDLTPYLFGISVTGELIADLYCYKGSSIFYPTNPLVSDDEFGAYYRVNGLTLEIVNPYGSCRARVLVVSQDNSAPSGGNGNKVWRQFFDGQQNVMQFIRPGAAEVPTLADIIVDSRWPAVRLLKEGIIGLSGNQSYPVTFDAGGLFPIVKFMTIHGPGGTSGNGQVQFQPGNYTKRVRPALMRRIFATGRASLISSDSTYCELTGGQAVFYSFLSNPRRYYSEETSTTPGYRITTDGDDNPPYALRYFIFGIPAS